MEISKSVISMWSSRSSCSCRKFKWTCEVHARCAVFLFRFRNCFLISHRALGASGWDGWGWLAAALSAVVSTVRVRQIQKFTFSRFTFRTKLGILIRCDVDWLQKEVLCYALHYHVFVWRLEYPLLNPYRPRLSLCRNLLHCHRLVPHLEALFVEVRVYQGDSKLWCGGAQVEKSS